MSLSLLSTETEPVAGSFTGQSWQVLAYRLAIQQLKTSQEKLTEQNQRLEQTVDAQTETLKHVVRELRQELLRCSQTERELKATQIQLFQKVEARNVALQAMSSRLQSEIIERQNVENALQQSQQRFRKLADNSPVIIYRFCMTPENIFSFPFMSSACFDILGYTPEDFYQSPPLLAERVHAHERPEFEASMVTSAQQLSQWNWEGRILSKSGDIRWIRLCSSPERQADGAIVWDGVLIDISDQRQAEIALEQTQSNLDTQVKNCAANLQQTIKPLPAECDRTQLEAALYQTESQLKQQTQNLENTVATLKRTQAQLAQSEKMAALGQLVTGVAHEINNPVSFIYGNLNPARGYTQKLINLIDLYRQHYPNPVANIQTAIEDIDLKFIKTDIFRVLNSMEVGAKRIKQIVVSLRNFSLRGDESEWTAVNVHQELDSTLLILEHLLKSQTHRPPIKVIKAYGHLPTIDGYAGQLNQVFITLLSNAVDALEEQYRINPKAPLTITLHTWIEQEQAMISISDTGVGMTAAVRERMFEPFFTTKAVNKGSGLGLSTSYQIVEQQHNGCLTCISQPGRGTSLLMQLPLQQ